MMGSGGDAGTGSDNEYGSRGLFADYSSFLAQQFRARHTRSLPTSDTSTTYEGRVFLASAEDTSIPRKATSGTVGASRRKNKHSTAKRRSKGKGGGRKRTITSVRDNSSDDSSGDRDEDSEQACQEADEESKSEDMHSKESEKAQTLTNEEQVEVRVSTLLLFTTSTTSTGDNDARGQSETEVTGRALEGVQSFADPIPLELWR